MKIYTWGYDSVVSYELVRKTLMFAIVRVRGKETRVKLGPTEWSVGYYDTPQDAINARRKQLNSRIDVMREKIARDEAALVATNSAKIEEVSAE
jgi:hypothetical protein